MEMSQNLFGYPRACGLWLDRAGNRYSIEIGRYDWRFMSQGKNSRGYALRAHGMDEGAATCVLFLNLGHDDDLLFDPKWVRTSIHPDARRVAVEATLVAAFRQALFYGRLATKQEVHWRTPDCPLRLTVVNAETLPTDREPEFSFEKDDTYLIEVANKVRTEIMRTLRPEYREGMRPDVLLGRVRLELETVEEETRYLVENKLAEWKIVPGSPGAERVSITDLGLAWLVNQEADYEHEADLRSVLSTSKGDFILPAGEALKAKRLVLRVMQSAKSTLTIVDEYLDDSVFDYLEAISPTVGIRMLTGGRKPMFKPLLDALKQSRSNVEAGICGEFHDRFIIVDDTDAWHLGASINGLGSKATRLSRVADEEERKRLLDSCKSWWNSATPI